VGGYLPWPALSPVVEDTTKERMEGAGDFTLLPVDFTQ